MHERYEKYNILVGKPEGKIPLRRTRRGLGDNVRKDLREIGCGIADWLHLA
jgi:hypothetical protein